MHTCIIYFIGTILVKRLQRAQKVEGESYTKLQQLIAASAGIIVCIEDNIHVKIILCINVGSIAMEDVELWLKDEASNFLLHNNSMSTYILLCNLSPALHAVCSIVTP